MARRPFMPQDGRKCIEYPLNATVPDIKEGAVVLLDGNEEIVEAGADPASILGVLVHHTKMLDGGDRDVLPTKATIALAGAGRTFIGELADGSGVKQVPDEDNINQLYGIAEDANGYWYVDESETVNTRVQIQRIDTELELVIFFFLEANLQMNN